MTTAIPTLPTVTHAWRDATFIYLSGPLYGYADAGTFVQVWNGATLLETVTVLPQGFWHSDADVPFPDGSYQVTVVGVGPGGARSAPSPVQYFLVDNHAPAAPTIVLDDPGVPVFLPARFSGSAEVGSVIDLRVGNLVIASALTDASGHWRASALVADGHYAVNATARDAAQNVSAPSSFDFARTMVDDFGNDAASAGALAVGGAVSAVIDYNGDIDWFRISLDTLTNYSFSVKGAKTGGGTLPMAVLQLWDPQGNGGKGAFLSMNINQRYDNGADLVMEISTVHSGVYYLAVAAAASGAVGSYTLGAVATSRDDYYRDEAHATTMAVGGVIAGRFEKVEDMDTFKLMLVAGTTYRFELDPGASLVNPMRLGLQLVDEAHSVRVYGGLTAEYKVVATFTPTASGTYFLSVDDYDYDYNSVGDYLLRAQVVTDDFGASIVNSGSLAIGATVHGVVEVSGDHDWFAVQLQANTAYTFALDQGDRGGAAIFYLHDASGARLDVNVQRFDQGTLLTWTPAASGTYFLDVGNSSGNTPYNLQARLGDVDDHGASPATAGRISVGQGISGRLEAPNDVDWYKVSLKANSAYTFGLQPAREGLSSTIRGGDLAIVDAFGRVQASGMHNNDTTNLTYQPVADGDFYVAVSGSYQVFSYTVSSVVNDQDRYLANDGTTGTLSAGGMVKSSIDFVGDADWIRVELLAGQTYRFELTGVRGLGGTLATPELQMFDSSGRYLQSSQHGGTGNDPQMSFIPTQSGTYYVQASATGGATGSYTLKEATATVAYADTMPPSVYRLEGPIYPGTDPQTDNIRILVNEVVTRGSGTIALRLASGELVESFDAATSTRLSFSAFTGEVTIDPSAALAYGTSYRIDMDATAIKDKAGLPLPAAYSDTFLTIERSLNVVGGAGNDNYVSTTGSDVIDGGAGIDSVRYHGNATGYTVYLANGSPKQVYGGGAVDSLVNIERIVFDDRALAYDSNGPAGQAYRLYQASFNRTPDAAGLGYWIERMDKGASLSGVAQAFVASAEFKALVGAAPSDDAFLTAMYSNVLHRAPDQAGHDYWAGILLHGAARENVLAEFSESAENQAAVIGQIVKGIGYIPYG